MNPISTQRRGRFAVLALAAGIALSALTLAASGTAHAQNVAGDTETADFRYVATGQNFVYGGPTSATFAAPSTTIGLAQTGQQAQISVQYNVSSIVITEIKAAGDQYGTGTFNGVELVNNNPRFSFANVTSTTIPGFDPATRFTATSTQLNFNIQGLNIANGQSITVSLTPVASVVPEPGTLALASVALLPVLGIVRRRLRAR